MRPSSLTALLLTSLLATSTSLPASAETAPAKRKAIMNEAYFSTDVDEAVLAAKRNPVNTNYVGARWYNRTTLKSFPMAKLMNTEMDEQIVEGAMGPTAAGEAAAEQAQQPAKDAALGRKNQDETLQDTQSEAVSHPSSIATKQVTNPQGVYISTANTSASSLGSSTVTNIRGLSVSHVTLRP